MCLGTFAVQGSAPCLGPYLPTAPCFPLTSSPGPGKRSATGRSGSNCVNGPRWCFSCTNTRACPTSRPANGLTSIRIRCATGGGAGRGVTSPWMMSRGGAANPAFPPLDEAIVKSLACDLVAQTQQPLSRQSLADLTDRAAAALQKSISRSTVWRVLHADALKPWQYEY